MGYIRPKDGYIDDSENKDNEGTIDIQKIMGKRANHTTLWKLYSLTVYYIF